MAFGDEVSAIEKLCEGENSFPHGLKVLLVDDDPVCGTMVAKLLRKCGYVVTVAVSGEEGLDLLRAGAEKYNSGDRDAAFDLVLSDVNMPGVDGFTVLGAISGSGGNNIGQKISFKDRETPVILMSASGDKALVMKGVLGGAADYMVKPVRMERLKYIWTHVLRGPYGPARANLLPSEDQKRRSDDSAGESLDPSATEESSRQENLRVDDAVDGDVRPEGNVASTSAHGAISKGKSHVDASVGNFTAAARHPSMGRADSHGAQSMRHMMPNVDIERTQGSQPMAFYAPFPQSGNHPGRMQGHWQPHQALPHHGGPFMSHGTAGYGDESGNGDAKMMGVHPNGFMDPHYGSTIRYGSERPITNGMVDVRQSDFAWGLDGGDAIVPMDRIMASEATPSDHAEFGMPMLMRYDEGVSDMGPAMGMRHLSDEDMWGLSVPPHMSDPLTKSSKGGGRSMSIDSESFAGGRPKGNSKKGSSQISAGAGEGGKANPKSSADKSSKNGTGRQGGQAAVLVTNGGGMDKDGKMKKPKVVWTPELHQKFLHALQRLGKVQAIPKRIMEVMNVPGLTRENIASHLQKYRQRTRKENEGSGEGMPEGEEPKEVGGSSISKMTVKPSNGKLGAGAEGAVAKPVSGKVSVARKDTHKSGGRDTTTMLDVVPPGDNGWEYTSNEGSGAMFEMVNGDDQFGKDWALLTDIPGLTPGVKDSEKSEMRDGSPSFEDPFAVDIDPELSNAESGAKAFGQLMGTEMGYSSKLRLSLNDVFSVLP